MAEKRITFSVSEELHKRMKIYAAKNGRTIKEILVECIVSLMDKGDKK